MTSLLVRLLTLLSFCLALALAPGSARADDPATRSAKRHFDRGEKLFALGKFDDALEEYQKAFDAKPLPDFLYNIGQCYRNLAEYDQAIFSFKKYLELKPDAADREKVEKLISELEDKQARGEGNKLVRPVKPPPHEESSPIYKKWWFWTGVALVGVAGGVGIYEGTKSSGPPDTTLGNFVFGR